MRLTLLFVLLAVLGLAAYVRLAPSDPAVWHVDPQVNGDETGAGEAKRRVPGDAATFSRLHDIILATPRTQVLAGDVAAAHITYVTRSAVWGFPDYTTVKFDGGAITIWGRLRFGASDLGVNAKRIDGWLAALAAS